MKVQQVLSKQVFSNGCEAHYAFRSHIDPADYPQVHDFYEIILIVSGTLNVTVNDTLLELKKGNMVLLRPGDVHSKIECGSCQHINLAFPAHTVEALFQFLYDAPNQYEHVFRGPVPICKLAGPDAAIIQNKLTYLNHLPSGSVRRRNTYLRIILTEIIVPDFTHEIKVYPQDSGGSDLPVWLAQAIDGLSNVQNLSEGMGYLTRQTNRTPEHICRAFQKYLSMTPMTYINAKRLNYAANLLLHTDMKIIDVAYESGFQSVSHFYHMFKSAYQLSPLQYKKQNASIHFE